jgi:hypoxanthine-DNA glycosylase
MADERRINSFPPIIDKDSRVLVLGTMPGAESLRQCQYYAFCRNQFWSVIFALYGLERPEDYDVRVRFLHEKHIALWDVLDACERRTSADSDIKKPEPNKIAELLQQYPKIEAVFLNGKGAAKLFNIFILPQIAIKPYIDILPSTSPAYTIRYEQKLDGWKKLLKYASKL